VCHAHALGQEKFQLVAEPPASGSGPNAHGETHAGKTPPR
jgi:hypothetical protein